MTYLSLLRRMITVSLVLLGMVLVGCQPPKPLGEEGATTPGSETAVNPLTKITELPTADLESLGAVNSLPTQWVLPNAWYTQYTAPVRFLKYKNAGDVVRFLQNNPNTMLYSDDFSSIETLISSNKFALVPLLDPQSGQVVQPQFPFPCTAIYTKRNRAIDQEKMKSVAFTNVEKEKIKKESLGGKEVFLFEQALQLPVDQEQKQFAKLEGITSALYFPTPDSSVMMIGPRQDVTDFFTNSADKGRGAMAQLVNRLDVPNLDFAFLFHYDQPMGSMQPSRFPDPLGQEIMNEAKFVLMTIDAGTDPTKGGIKMIIDGKTNESAAKLQTALGSTLMTLAEQSTKIDKLPPGVTIPDYLKNLDAIVKLIKTDLVNARLTATLPATDAVSALFAGFFKDVNEQAEKTARMQRTAVVAEQLAALSRAMTSYYSKHNSFPPTSINDASGKPMLSWRVALLPLFGPEGEALYKQFKLDEPWNGPNNIKLLEKIPAIFVCQSNPSLKTKTTFQIFNSPETPFGKNPKGTKIQDLANPSKTLMIVSVHPNHAVEWTQPESLPFKRDKLVDLFGDMVVAAPAMGDVFRASFTGEEKGIAILSNLILGIVPDAAKEPAKPAAADAKPAAPAAKPAATDAKPAASAEKPASTAKPAVSAEKPASTAKPAASAEKPASTAKPAAPAEKPASTAKPAAPAEKPASAAKPAAPAEKPASTAKPAAPAAKEPVKESAKPAVK